MSVSDAPLFRNAEFLKIWSVGLLTGIMRWLEMLALGVYAFDITGSPSLVALLVILRFLPMALFGVFFGALADLISPKRLLIFGALAIALTSAVMFLLFRSGEAVYWHVALAAFLSGAFWASDMPIRRKMIGDVVGPDRLAGGMSLDQATSNGTRALGPFLGGVLYETLGLAGVFGLGVALYGAAALMTTTIAAGEAPAAAASAGWERLLRPVRGAWEAVKVAARDPDIARILLVTIILNIWGFPYVSMIPVIGRDHLALSADVIGAITSAEGAFALVGAITVGRLAKPRWFRLIYLGGTLALMGIVFLIGIAPSQTMLTVGLCAAGLAIACFAAMQSTLIYMVAPPGMQGRFLGLMTICIGTGVIGFANIGITAEYFGAANAMWIVALEGLAPALLVTIGWRRLFTG